MERSSRYHDLILENREKKKMSQQESAFFLPPTKNTFQFSQSSSRQQVRKNFMTPNFAKDLCF